MTICRVSDADKAALKAATRRLLDAAGGLVSASMACRAGKTSLGRFGSVNDEQFMPADVIADLEADIGEPVVTRELARLAGYKLVPIRADQSSPPDDPALMATRIVRELGEYAAAVEAMDADGRRDVHELEACRDAMDDVVHEGRKTRDALQRQIIAAKQGRAA